MRLTCLAVALPLAGRALAWGALGHRTIAAIAQTYLTSDTKTWVSSILGSDTMVRPSALFPPSFPL